MITNISSDIDVYRKEALSAAGDLGYGSEVISKIKKATTIGQIEIAMITARKEKFDDTDNAKA